MSSTDTSTLSRRQFLSVCGACGTGGVAVQASTPAAATSREQFPPEGESGTISAEGEAAIAAVDEQLAQQGGNFGQTVNAVSDLGLDPNGNTPITQAFEAAAATLSNVRIDFPSDGVFRVSSRIVLDPAGPIELVGNGATLKIDSGMKERTFNCPRLPGGSIIRGFVIDQTSQDSVTGLRIGTEGTVEVRDVTLKGYSATVPYSSSDDGVSVLTPIARTRSAVVRVTNFTAIGGTAAGMHTDPDKPESAPENRLGAPIGMWVGQSNVGTVQLVNPRLRGWSNGTYSSRTKGTVQILGGLLWNNSNTQARVGGGAVIDGTTMVLDDRKWSMQQNPGPYTLGGNQGVHAVRVEIGGEKGTQSKPVRLRNLDIRGLSMATSSSLINFEGSASAGSVTNCRITNHIDVPSLLAVSPGSQGGYGAAAQTNVLVDQCLFSGSSSDTIIEVDDRPSSRIQKTCIQIPDAGPESISGMQIGTGVGFGQTCAAGGLREPSAVGSGASLSAMNFSAAGEGAPPGAGSQMQLKAAARHVTVTVLLVIALVAVVVLLSLGGLWKLID